MIDFGTSFDYTKYCWCKCC